jgi:hypothetical protein
MKQGSQGKGKAQSNNKVNIRLEINFHHATTVTVPIKRPYL